MKIVVNKSKCAGHTRCNATAPDLFPLDDVGYIAIEHLDVPAGSEADARRGARACPERAISIAQEEPGKVGDPVG